MTLKELQKRYESGEKQIRGVQQQIRAQLSRKCLQRECDASLAFSRRTRLLCDRHKGIPLAKAKTTNANKPVVKKRTAAERKRINREKKKRYYERHGIVRNRNIRNRDYDISQTTLEKGTALQYDGQVLIYENYKEPLKPIEKSKGYGYYGTIASTDDKMFVQCHICGNLFEHVGLHIRVHKISGERYREIYQLASGTSLISEQYRENLQKRAVKPYEGKLPKHLAEYNRAVQEGRVKHYGNKGKNNDKRGSWTLEKRNKEGLCPDQVLEKIKDLADELGTTPSYEEFVKHYNHRFVGSIKLQHGSYSAAVKKLGMKTRDELRRVDKDTLIRDLQTFYKEHDRIPMTSDFNRGLLRDKGAFIRAFGTLNNARIEAGMDAVVPMPFGKILQLTPEQYFEYQQNHIPKSKRRGKRNIQRV